MTKSRRQQRIERKIKRSKQLRDQFTSDQPMIQERIDSLRKDLLEEAEEKT